MNRKPVYMYMPYGAFGDQLAFLGAARIYAQRHPQCEVWVNVLPEIVAAYTDGLLHFHTKPMALGDVAFECVNRHRVKNSSPDKNYVGCYLAALGESVDEAPAFEPPYLPVADGLKPQGYIAIQPYSTFARNAADRDAFVQALADQCRKTFPDLPLVCLGRPDTRRDIKDVNYDYLGWNKDVLQVIEHARYVLTPRSASAHIAAGYRVPSFVWVPGDGEDWHLNYPNWPHLRVSVDHPPARAAAFLQDFFQKGTNTMGDVARILSSRQGNLQSVMHDRVVLEKCENVHLHWRNVRIEMSISDAARMLDIFWWGSDKILKAVQGKVVSIPLDSICPYNNSHRRLPNGDFENENAVSTEQHHIGVDWMVEQIKAGRKIRPIAVRPAWLGAPRFPRPEDKRSGNIFQRLDGFKRYMAHRKLGLSFIDCFVIDGDRPGCQDSMSAFLDANEAPPSAFDPADFVESGKDNLSLIDGDKQRYEKNEVEQLTNGLIHVHIGDTRLEFDRDGFREFSGMISEAAQRL